MQNEVPIPRTISKYAQSFIILLLNKDPRKRLGGGPRGFEEIKEHPLFMVWLHKLFHELLVKILSHWNQNLSEFNFHTNSFFEAQIFGNCVYLVSVLLIILISFNHSFSSFFNSHLDIYLDIFYVTVRRDYI